MTVVFVHGVPDTYRVWTPIRQHLARPDVLALALPGFNSPLPGGFSATKEAYVDWLIAQLETQEAPVDLVGHDWGCILTARVASLRPDLVRTWAGGSGPISAQYKWHPLAQMWQTPGDGEKWMADLEPVVFSRQLQDYGVPAEAAGGIVARMDETLKDCILRLYRSAVHVGSEWEPGLANVTAPSLVFWGVEDPACPIAFADHLGNAMEASEILKLSCGHWTILNQPEAIAQALTHHWASASV